jgi:hypothetical protein
MSEKRALISQRSGSRAPLRYFVPGKGDERDVIFISIGYGPDAQGRMTAGFGPLSSDGGERRLNVLISRARLQCSVFSSITAGDIPADTKPRGTRMLREFLYYAETKHIAAGQVNGADYDSPFEEAVAITIRRGGYEVSSQVGGNWISNRPRRPRPKKSRAVYPRCRMRRSDVSKWPFGTRPR